MTLRNKILLNKLLIPSIVLVALVIYILSQSLFSYGFLMSYFVPWLVFALTIFYGQTNHLIKYSNESEIINLTLRKGINTEYKINIPIDKVVYTKLDTRIFGFGFDRLSIKYVDEEGLYNLQEIRIDNKKDWIHILALIELKDEIREI